MANFRGTGVLLDLRPGSEDRQMGAGYPTGCSESHDRDPGGAGVRDGAGSGRLSTGASDQVLLRFFAAGLVHAGRWKLLRPVHPDLHFPLIPLPCLHTSRPLIIPPETPVAVCQVPPE